MGLLDNVIKKTDAVTAPSDDKKVLVSINSRIEDLKLQNLENAKYRIAVNDGKTVTENIYSRFSDERNSDETHIRAIVTEGSFDHQTEETLFEFDVK